mmetsp:Transcript_34316/g.67486  ORF Transcript_34316/g.67486 Transcript_34316/m.67486 type:complete len:314 (-) Transcript_34316:111-1052(-)
MNPRKLRLSKRHRPHQRGIGLHDNVHISTLVLLHSIAGTDQPPERQRHGPVQIPAEPRGDDRTRPPQGQQAAAPSVLPRCVQAHDVGHARPEQHGGAVVREQAEGRGRSARPRPPVQRIERGGHLVEPPPEGAVHGHATHRARPVAQGRHPAPHLRERLRQVVRVLAPVPEHRAAAAVRRASPFVVAPDVVAQAVEIADDRVGHGRGKFGVPARRVVGVQAAAPPIGAEEKARGASVQECFEEGIPAGPVGVRADGIIQYYDAVWDTVGLGGRREERGAVDYFRRRVRGVGHGPRRRRAATPSRRWPKGCGSN